MLPPVLGLATAFGVLDDHVEDSTLLNTVEAVWIGSRHMLNRSIHLIRHPLRTTMSENRYDLDPHPSLTIRRHRFLRRSTSMLPKSHTLR